MDVSLRRMTDDEQQVVARVALMVHRLKAAHLTPHVVVLSPDLYRDAEHPERGAWSVILGLPVVQGGVGPDAISVGVLA